MPQKIVERTRMRCELVSISLQIRANVGQWNRCGELNGPRTSVLRWHRLRQKLRQQHD